ncbi:MAG: efflux RND transporter periplasmic adaptor subunit [Planctomycetes bacterium]|jgi:RND family efflux transporter MFP subunit|nr:efflux RND transporter periplasmic adaptor subunit [Planctomycetota bacterium]
MTDTTRNRSAFRRIAGALGQVVLKILLPLAVLVSAGFAAQRMLETAPKAPRGASARQAKLVEVVEAGATSSPAKVSAMGLVLPARRVLLSSQVSGRVEWVCENLIPGGRLAEGAPIARIERRDFELAIAERESDILVAEAAVIEAARRLAETERDLRVEEGSQAVAKSEIEAFGETLDPARRDLVLRVPQIAAVRAQVEAARAAISAAQANLAASRTRLDNARLQLDRTIIAAPFSAVVAAKSVEVGDILSPGRALCELIGSAEYWVELRLPVTDLRFLEIPTGPGESGSAVRIRARAGEGAGHTGRVLRGLPTVDEQGRMARVLVSVPDPLAATPDDASLLLGSYVHAEIEGRSLGALIVLPRALLRDGDRAWVMNPDGRLSIRALDIAFRGRDEVLVRSGLRAGEAVVVTDLSAPVDGMALRLGADRGKKTPEAERTAGGGDR